MPMDLSFEELPSYIKTELVSLKKWPIPNPSPDQVVMAFLAQHEVQVNPAQLPGFDGYDLFVGFVSNFEYAQLNSINRNQAKQAQHQEWTSWKQWALSHADFASFKSSLIASIDDENISRLDWLNGLEGKALIASLEAKHQKALEAGRAAIRLFFAFAASFLGLMFLVESLKSVPGFIVANTRILLSFVKSGDGAQGASSRRDVPEPQGISQERALWLSGKCIDVQSQKYLEPPASDGRRDFCRERDRIIESWIQLQQKK